jgi:hypothetical protein
VVIGGGEFGTYHARQLLKAERAGAIEGEVVVVDRESGCRAFTELAGAPAMRPVVSDWASYLRAWLPTARPEDHLVPAPLSPHLLWEWLAGEVGGAPAEPPAGWRLPYEVPGPPGVRFLSAAGWTCPATCIEPGHCPVMHAPRDWDLGDLIEERAVALGWEPAVFRCLHLTHGIGTVPVESLLDARARAADLPPADRLLVATSSRCHAAVGGLTIASSG